MSISKEEREQLWLTLDLLARVLAIVLLILCGYLMVVGMCDFIVTGPDFHALSVAGMIPDCVSRHYLAGNKLLLASIGFLAVWICSIRLKEMKDRKERRTGNE